MFQPRSRIRIVWLAFILAFPAPASSPPYTLLNSIPAPAASADLFGFSVALEGTWLAVGVPYDDTGGLDAGTVRVYDLAGGSPTAPALTLTNPHPVMAAYFGISVAISGTRVVVGVINAGAAGGTYIYDIAGPTPGIPMLTLVNPRPKSGDSFGQSVAISGSKVVVGAPYDDDAAFGNGRAYVYDLAGATPSSSVLTLTNPSPALEDYFGFNVAISGARIVVGAHGNDTGATNAGSACVYDLQSGHPASPVLTLTNPTPAVDEWFGYAVSISGSRLVIGAYGDHTGGIYAGSAYVYELAGANPAVPTLRLAALNPAAGDAFGSVVAIAGTRVVVGARGEDAGALDAGGAYLFDLTGAAPALPLAKVGKPNPARGDQFGSAVAIHSNMVVVGASLIDAAYVFGPAPVLHFAPAAPGLATIWWSPQTTSGFVLQHTDDLRSGNWATGGDINPVTVPATNGSRFYRLFRP